MSLFLYPTALPPPPTLFPYTTLFRSPLPARTGLTALSRLLTLPDRVTAVCEFLAHPIRQVRGSAPTDIIPCIVEPGAVTPRRDRSEGALRMVSTGGDRNSVV